MSKYGWIGWLIPAIQRRSLSLHGSVSAVEKMVQQLEEKESFLLHLYKPVYLLLEDFLCLRGDLVDTHHVLCDYKENMRKWVRKSTSTQYICIFGVTGRRQELSVLEAEMGLNWKWVAKAPHCKWPRSSVYPWYRLPQETILQGPKRVLMGFWYCCPGDGGH